MTAYRKHNIFNGNTKAWGAGPHWLKGEMLDRSPSVGYVPVAYSSQNTIWTRAKWTGNVDISGHCIIKMVIMIPILRSAMCDL